MTHPCLRKAFGAPPTSGAAMGAIKFGVKPRNPSFQRALLWPRTATLHLLLTLLAVCLHAEEKITRLKSDEQIVFYPSVAQRVPGKTNLWRTTIRGCVFEPEKRRLLVATFREAMELKTEEMNSAEEAIFKERARSFLVDHERGRKVFIRLGTNEFYVGTSGANGNFSAEISFSDADWERRAPARLDATADQELAERVLGAPFAALLGPGDERVFSGAIFPLEAGGLSIISDIDDTIKVTEVRDRKATLRNTFLREFQAVPGMAEFYQTLACSNDAAFHYISASPWQLYEPLAAFVATNRFPAGTFELKPFRWKGRSFFSLFADPEKYKPGVIEPLLKQFPKRQFILIGDSGERDPEIYAALARKFPEQITRIYIRDVTNEPAEAARYQTAFRDVPPKKWQIFREPRELESR